MWRYVIDSGFVYAPSGAKVWTGYAGGNCGKNPEGKNNPLMCMVPDVGPLPPAVYTMAEVVEGSHLGPFAIRLVPAPNAIMMGRSEFFIHGDTTPSGDASSGCIIAARFIRNQMWNGGDHTITVVATEG